MQDERRKLVLMVLVKLPINARWEEEINADGVENQQKIVTVAIPPHLTWCSGSIFLKKTSKLLQWSCNWQLLCVVWLR